MPLLDIKNSAEYRSIKNNLLGKSYKEKSIYLENERKKCKNKQSSVKKIYDQEKFKKYYDALKFVIKELKDKGKENKKKLKEYYEKYLDMYKKFKIELENLENEALLKYENILKKFKREAENLKKNYSSQDIELLRFLKKRQEKNDEIIIYYLIGIAFSVTFAFIVGYYHELLSLS